METREIKDEDLKNLPLECFINEDKRVVQGTLVKGDYIIECIMKSNENVINFHDANYIKENYRIEVKPKTFKSKWYVGGDGLLRNVFINNIPIKKHLKPLNKELTEWKVL